MKNQLNQYSFKGVIFDLDGVITKTALVHAAAWKETFDEYLLAHAKKNNREFREFNRKNDYLTYVDGKPRYEGVRSFLESRNIHLELGDPKDLPERETICGIGNRKNQKFREVLEKKGAEVYDSTICLIKDLKSKGIRIGVASSSKNCQPVLAACAIEELFETRVDGVVSAELGLKGKPEPDIFVKAASNLGIEPKDAVVVEDAESGVLAGRNGAFGLVLGIARENNTNQLFASGADLVINDLKDINSDIIQEWFQRIPRDLNQAWEKDLREIDFKSEKEVENITVNPAYLKSAANSFLSNKKTVFFLDYDGTLTPIVSRPELAVLDSAMLKSIEELSKKHAVAVVSGRERETVEKLVGLKGIFYAGSHGFDIKGPDMFLIQPSAEKTAFLIEPIVKDLEKRLKNIPGVLIEEKKFSVAVHYRLVEDKAVSLIKEDVYRVAAKEKSLRLMEGKKVFEILPAFDWHKGKAVDWIMRALGLDWAEANIIYIGDDTTDEDAFRMIRSRGTAILVADEPRPSAADFMLRSCDEVRRFFERLTASA